MLKFPISHSLRSSILSILQRFSITIFGFSNFMMLARHLSKKQIGIWALFTIIITTFELSKSSLLKAAHIRLVNTVSEINQKNRISWSSLTLNGLLSILFIAFIYIFSNKISYWLNSADELSELFFLYIPGLAAMVFFSHYEAVLSSFIDFKSLFIGSICRQISFTLPILYHFFFNIPLSLEKLVVYNVFSNMIGALSLFILSYKHLSFSIQTTKESIKKIVNFGSYVFGSGVVSNIFSNMDQILTSRYLNPISVSYYNTATRISGFVEIPSFAVADVMFPKMSKISADDNKDKIAQVFERTVALLLSLIIPIVVVVLIFAKFFITIIAGASFKNSTMILQIYVACSVLGIIQNQSANTLTSIGKSKICFTMNSISVIIKLTIIYLFLKYFGFYGAAFGTIAITLINFIIWQLIMKHHVNINFSNIFSQIIFFYKQAYSKVKGVIFKKDKLTNS